VLVIAIAKGRFLDPSLEMLGQVGVSFEENLADSRRLIFDSKDGNYRVILVKPVDVPTYVEYGAADAGITGRDVLLESGADVLQPLDLGFGRCKLAVAAPTGTLFSDSDRAVMRVATKYPTIALNYFNSKNIPVEIIPLSGSIELGPLVGLADQIVDLVETGRTLHENGLEIVDVIAESSARLVINRANYQTKRAEVVRFVDALENLRRESASESVT
jgi:ATP phosphoribosyltransferase